MRTCYIEKLSCERKVPYNPDDHSALLRDGWLENQLVEVAKGRLQIRCTFLYRIKGKSDDKEWGRVEGTAIVTVTDDSIEPSNDGKSAKVGETTGHVIQGALQDDIFLAITHVVRAMHLPGMLFLPEFEKKPEDKKAPKGTA
jgi:hypothetical protein